MFGRNGEALVLVLAAQSPPTAFPLPSRLHGWRSSTDPVVILSDCYIANGAEPCGSYLTSTPSRRSTRTAHSANATDKSGEPVFLPYLRDPESLARPWAIPGTAGLEHCIGGIEKAKDTGVVSYVSGQPRGDGPYQAGQINGIVQDTLT